MKTGKTDIIIEDMIKEAGVEVYPVTLLKFLLNKKKILFYFYKVGSPDFKFRGPVYTIDNKDCENCHKTKHFFCRQHYSIYRIIQTQNYDTIWKDTKTGLFFFKNEIFKHQGNRLIIVYVPHTKLIHEELTKDKVKKVYPITIIDPFIEEFKFLYPCKEFNSDDFYDKRISCWFNDEFTININPINKNDQKIFWNLTLNK